MSVEQPEWLSLDDGERIEWAGEPELVSRIGELLLGILLLPLLGLGLLVLVPTYLSVTHTDYVVTNQSLYKKQGILSTNIASLELDRIQNTEFNQSFTEKLLGYGTVGVSTAGSSGIEMSFDAIGEADEVRELVRELSKQYRETSHESSAETTDPMAEIADELARTREALENVDRAISQVLAARNEGGDDRAGQRNAGPDGRRTGGGDSGTRESGTRERQPGGDRSDTGRDERS